MVSHRLVLTPLSGIPNIKPGDDLSEITLSGLAQSGEQLQSGDILVFAQKVISKAEGRSIDLRTVKPSSWARDLEQKTGKDARLIELILQESSEIVRQRENLIIVRHRLGFVLANAGIDASNVDGDDHVLLLPLDPDASADAIRIDVSRRVNSDIGVLIIDSLGRPWRNGTIGTAIGLSGLPGVIDLRGVADLNGRPLQATEIAFSDELAAAASLIMGQAAEGTPIVHVRGAPYPRRSGNARELLRPPAMDLFR